MLTIGNAGLDLATNEIVTDLLLAETTLAAAILHSPTCTKSNGLVTCTIGDLAAVKIATVTPRVFGDCRERSLTLTNPSAVTSMGRTVKAANTQYPSITKFARAHPMATQHLVSPKLAQSS